MTRRTVKSKHLMSVSSVINKSFTFHDKDQGSYSLHCNVPNLYFLAHKASKDVTTHLPFGNF